MYVIIHTSCVIKYQIESLHLEHNQNNSHNYDNNDSNINYHHHYNHNNYNYNYCYYHIVEYKINKYIKTSNNTIRILYYFILYHLHSLSMSFSPKLNLTR